MRSVWVVVLLASVSCSPPMSGASFQPAQAGLERSRVSTLVELPTLDSPEAPPVSEPTPPAAAEAPPAKRGPIPPVDEVRVDKGDHRLDLVSKGAVVRSYKVGLGPGGMGPKRWEWDMVTPVGTYTITGRYKLFHQFLAISYPNRDDKIRYAELQRQGLVPPGRTVGDGIGVHGGGSGSDWTAGCIAVEDHEIDEIVGVVKPGTKIVITD